MIVGLNFFHRAAWLIASVAFLAVAVPSYAACETPLYQGVTRSASLHFLSSEQGYLEMHAKGKKKIMTFETTYSNGFSREYMRIASIKDLDSVVMSLNIDFTPARAEPAAFLITPDLPVKYYYATMMNPTLHDFIPDDTWKFVRCESH